MTDIPWFFSLQDALSSLFPNSSISILKENPIGGGCINGTSVLTLSNGASLFIKTNSPDMENMFRTEAAGLSELGKVPGSPRVPQVFCGGTDKDRSFLLMEYCSPGVKSSAFSEDLGSSLAHMHKNARSSRCGLQHSNFIGASVQINTPSESWIDFFRQRRLEVQLKMARDKGLADSHLTGIIIGLMDHLENFLIPCDDGQSSLLHGDLWSGNVISDEEGRAVIIDPAVYYGHREADIAMTELFGGFNSSFYRGYNETWPLEEGYSRRRDLYNLYHMLNHLNLFGSSYAGSVLSIVRKYTS